MLDGHPVMRIAFDPQPFDEGDGVTDRFCENVPGGAADCNNLTCHLVSLFQRYGRFGFLTTYRISRIHRYFIAVSPVWAIVV